MNRTRYIPSIIMLTAAFVACIATIYYKYSTKDILLIVLGVSVIFFILGLFVKMIAEKYLVIDTKKETIEENESEGEEADNAESEENKEENNDK